MVLLCQAVPQFPEDRQYLEAPLHPEVPQSPGVPLCQQRLVFPGGLWAQLPLLYLEVHQIQEDHPTLGVLPSLEFRLYPVIPRYQGFLEPYQGGLLSLVGPLSPGGHPCRADHLCLEDPLYLKN